MCFSAFGWQIYGCMSQTNGSGDIPESIGFSNIGRWLSWKWFVKIGIAYVAFHSDNVNLSKCDLILLNLNNELVIMTC